VAWTLVADSVATTMVSTQTLACVDPTFEIAVMGDKL
jgi:hypothetical protein